MIDQQQTQLRYIESEEIQNSAQMCQNIINIEWNQKMPSPEHHLTVKRMIEQLDVEEKMKTSEVLLQHLLQNYKFFGEEVVEQTTERCDVCQNYITKSSFILHHDHKPIKLEIGSCCLQLMENFGFVRNRKKIIREFQRKYCLDVTKRLLPNLDGQQKQLVSTIIRGYEKDKTTYPSTFQRNKLFRLFERQGMKVNKYNFRVRIWKVESFQKVKPKRHKNIRFKIDKKRSSRRKSNSDSEKK